MAEFNSFTSDDVRKLGRTFLSFSIPAVFTCKRGSSEPCREVCYADGSFFSMTSSIVYHTAAYFFTLMTMFVSCMVQTIRSQRRLFFRIHAGGDFYSPEYVKKWVSVVRKCPAVTFLVYTRTWRDPEMRKYLRELASLPNVRMWLSADHRTGRPAKIKGAVGVAYMAMTDDDVATFPVDLVFRVRRSQNAVKRIGGVLVCPHEQGVRVRGEDVSVRMKCDQCRVCLRSGPPPGKREVVGKNGRGLPVLEMA